MHFPPALTPVGPDRATFPGDRIEDTIAKANLIMRAIGPELATVSSHRPRKIVSRDLHRQTDSQTGAFKMK